MATPSSGRTTIPESLSKLQEIRTGRWGRGLGNHVQNQGGKHSRNHNAAEAKTVGRVSDRLENWCAKRAQERKAAKEARKAKHKNKINKPLTQQIHKLGEWKVYV